MSTTNTEKMPVHTSDRFLSGLEIFEFRIRLQDGRGPVLTAQLRARDLRQAAEIAKRYATRTGSLFMIVLPVILCDPSILEDETVDPVQVTRDDRSESVSERLARVTAESGDADDDDDGSANEPRMAGGRSPRLNGRVGA